MSMSHDVRAGDYANLLHPRTRFGGRDESDGYDGRDKAASRHQHFADPGRVAAVEQAVATGLDLAEATQASGLTPHVCWSIAVRLARPNALEIHLAEHGQARQWAAQLQATMAGVLGQLHRLANRLSAERLPQLSDRALAVIVILEDSTEAATDRKGGVAV